VTEQHRQRAPHGGDVWEQNKTGRRVRIEDTDYRWTLIEEGAE
jgi:hypothetical protein